MAKISVNLQKTSLSFEPMPLGSYTATITEVESTLSKQQKPMLAVHLAITWPGFEGRTAYLYASLEANALFSLGYLLLAADLYDEDELKAGDIEFDPEDLIGKEIGLLVTQDRKNPENTNQRAIAKEDATGPLVDSEGNGVKTAKVEPAQGVASLF